MGRRPRREEQLGRIAPKGDHAYLDGQISRKACAHGVPVALPRGEERSGSHVIKRFGGLGRGEDEDQLVHRLRPAPRTPCRLAGDGAGSLAQIGEKLFRGIVRGRQKETRGCFDPPYPFENPPLRAFPDALQCAKASHLGRLLELGHRGDTRSAQGFDPGEAQLRYAAQVRGTRGVLLPKLLEALGRARPVELRYHGGQTRPDTVKLGQPLLDDEAAQIATQPLEGLGGPIVRAHLESRLAGQVEQPRHLPKAAGDGETIELAFPRRERAPGPDHPLPSSSALRMGSSCGGDRRAGPGGALSHEQGLRRARERSVAATPCAPGSSAGAGRPP